MNTTFPRVLFLTPLGFNHITGTGVTFTSLFTGWPKDALLTVTGDNIPVSRDVCDRYFFLTPRELDFIFPFDRLYPRQPSAFAEEGNASPAPAAPRSLVVRLGKKIIGGAGIPDKGVLSAELAAAVAAFAPEVIHTIPGSVGYIDLAAALAAASGAPLVVHIMDDGVTSPRQPGLFGPYLRRRYRRKFQGLLPRVTRAVAICEMMAAEYQGRYGRRFVFFQHTVDTASVPAPVASEPQSGRPFRLLYVGAVTPQAQLQSLLDCSLAVKALNERGFAVSLTIRTPLAYLPVPPERMCPHPAVTVEDVPPTDAAFFQALAEADGLLLPVNFDPLSVHFIRLSMPTKVPGYMASGTPILVYGPPHTAQVDYAAKSGWGLVVPRRDPEALAAAIRRLATDAALRRRLSETARRAARENHDAAVVRQGFREMLWEAAREGAGA